MKNILIQKGVNILQLDHPRNLTPGTYYITISGTSFNGKAVIVKLFFKRISYVRVAYYHLATSPVHHRLLLYLFQRLCSFLLRSGV